MKLVGLIKRLGLLGFQKKIVTAKDIGKSYTCVSSGYDNRFLKEMHIYNDEVLAAFKTFLPTDTKCILDLACGTGYNSKILEQSFEQAMFYMVDISQGMLKEAKKKEIKNAIYIQRDMLGYLKTQRDNTLDGVVCCWAIKYQNPKKIIKEVHRVLKPNGVFAVLVNTKGTLPEIRQVYPLLLLNDPSIIKRIMIPLPNPRNLHVFLRWFRVAGFKIVKARERNKVFRFENEKSLTKWVTHTGALAGFDCMIDLKDAQVQEKLTEVLHNKGITSITHSFVWAILRK